MKILKNIIICSTIVIFNNAIKAQCPQPTNFSAQWTTPTSILLTWDPITTPINWDFHYRTGCSLSPTWLDLLPNSIYNYDTFYVYNSVLPNETYYCALQVYCYDTIAYYLDTSDIITINIFTNIIEVPVFIENKFIEAYDLLGRKISEFDKYEGLCIIYYRKDNYEIYEKMFKQRTK